MLINTSRVILRTLILLNLFTFAPILVSAAVPAFPGAQGGGAASVGGRGGQVIAVTNLNDSGAGSLRACVTASGPRTCVFRVGGTIQLLSKIVISNPYLTVAGQTAPGGGILLSGKNMSQHMFNIWTHNVILRYVRIRGGYSVGGNDNKATLSVYPGSNLMLDHNSVSWNQDEGINVWCDPGSNTSNITISSNLVAEGLKNHSTGGLTGGGCADQQTDIDWHRNLIMNESHRNPLVMNKRARIINNLFYNHSFYSNQLQGGVNADIIGNLYKKGPMYGMGFDAGGATNGLLFHEIEVTNNGYSQSATGNPSVYLSGNLGWNQSNPAGDQWLMASEVTFQNGSEVGPVPTGWRRASAMANTTYRIVAEPVANIEASILSTVGASRRLACDGTWVAARDSVDSRLVNQYQTNTGISAIPVTEADVGGFPTIAGGTPCADADLDGMPDVWEGAHGLNPNLYADTNQDRDGDGYTNLEEYISGTDSITPPPPPPPPAPPPAPPPPSSCAQTPLNISAVSKPGGFAYFVAGSFGTPADNANKPTQSILRLFEGSLELGPEHALYADIQNLGQGRLLHWSQPDGTFGGLYFSASDNTDPRTNGRRYAYCADPTPPTVSITARANGATVSGTAVTVSATAADNVGVAGVQFKLDGANLGAEDTTAPYSVTWNSTTAANGAHALTALARDAAGNSTTSAGVSVTVSNAVSCTQTPLNVSAISKPGGFAYFVAGSFGTPADNANKPTQSILRLFEGSLELGPKHALYADIQNLGHGRLLHWSQPDGTFGGLYFSASDNTDPRTNGRSYAYCVPNT